MADEAGELRRQVAALQIQNARMRDERDFLQVKHDAISKAFESTKKENEAWSKDYHDLIRRCSEACNDRNQAMKQCGDLADGLIEALGMSRIPNPSGGFENPSNKTIIAEAARFQDQLRGSWQTLEECGFPPEAAGWPFIDPDLPSAISSVIETLQRQKDDLAGTLSRNAGYI